MLNSEIYPAHNVKMPTADDILTFISRKNKTSESSKARNIFIFQHFSFYEKLKVPAQLSWAWKTFYNLEAWVDFISLFNFLHGG